MRIILVGDDVLSPDKLQVYLREAFLQAEVVFCPCGSQAPEATFADRVIAIAHMNLPGQEHGLEVLKQIKKANRSAYTMLLMRMGLFRELEERAKEGADAVIGIPIQGKAFRGLLRKVARSLEDREDRARRREVFRQINSSLVKTNAPERPWQPLDS